MRGKRIFACLLSAALVAGMLPGAAFAAEAAAGCENHLEHTAGCGYGEGRACGHACALCAPRDSGQTGGAFQSPGVLDSGFGAAVPFAAPSGDYSFASGVLTIRSYAGTTAWRNDSGISLDSVTSVVLESGVSKIGSEAFADCTELETVDFSAVDGSLTEIQTKAFQGCAALELDGLPSSLTTIGYHAFENCTNLALPALPDGITSIGSSAFAQCYIVLR